DIVLFSFTSVVGISPHRPTEPAASSPRGIRISHDFSAGCITATAFHMDRRQNARLACRGRAPLYRPATCRQAPESRGPGTAERTLAGLLHEYRAALRMRTGGPFVAHILTGLLLFN